MEWVCEWIGHAHEHSIYIIWSTFGCRWKNKMEKKNEILHSRELHSQWTYILWIMAYNITENLCQSIFCSVDLCCSCRWNRVLFYISHHHCFHVSLRLLSLFCKSVFFFDSFRFVIYLFAGLFYGGRRHLCWIFHRNGNYQCVHNCANTNNRAKIYLHTFTEKMFALLFFALSVFPPLSLSLSLGLALCIVYGFWTKYKTKRCT